MCPHLGSRGPEESTRLETGLSKNKRRGMRSTAQTSPPSRATEGDVHSTACCKPCTRAAAPTPEAPFHSPQPRGKPLNTVWLQHLKQSVQTTANGNESLWAAAAALGCSHKQAPPAPWGCPKLQSHSEAASTATQPPVPHALWGPRRQHSPRQTAAWWDHTASPCRPPKKSVLWVFR